VSLRITAAVVLALGLLGPLTAEAHRRAASTPATPDVAAPAPAATAAPDPPPVLSAGPSFQTSPWLGAAVLGGAIGLRVLSRSRSARRWALLLLFASFTAELAVHGAHHVGDPGGAAHCDVLSLGQHLSAASPIGPDLESPRAAPVAVLALRPETAATSTRRAPDRGRAPPLLSS
jgi:hypothetical protein